MNSRSGTVKIGFVLLSNRNNPLASTRVSVLNMMDYLKHCCFEPTIIFEPKNADETPHIDGLCENAKKAGIKIVYFQKVHGQSVIKEAIRLRENGIKTVFGVCDLIDNEMVAFTDATICVTEYLKSLYDSIQQVKIHVVHDGIERPEKIKLYYRTTKASYFEPLQTILVTSSDLDEIPIVGKPPPFVRATIIGNYQKSTTPWNRIRSDYWALRQKSSTRERLLFVKRRLNMGVNTINWHPDTVYDHMMISDVGIIAVDTKNNIIPSSKSSYWQVKSENRLTMKMALGLPVIATPIPAYEKVIEHGKNGFFAHTRRDWIDCFEILRDPRAAQEIGQCARDSVLTKFSKEEQARKLIYILNNLAISQ